MSIVDTYIKRITGLLNNCDDIELLDLVHKLLQQSG